ncbi:MAG: hypothetical protein GDA36_02425 [Rhodobacteraceae bacterium]|nr:hypothetical protein [Paracoccaceae bacterium]
MIEAKDSEQLYEVVMLIGRALKMKKYTLITYTNTKIGNMGVRRTHIAGNKSFNKCIFTYTDHHRRSQQNRGPLLKNRDAASIPFKRYLNSCPIPEVDMVVL